MLPWVFFFGKAVNLRYSIHVCMSKLHLVSMLPLFGEFEGIIDPPVVSGLTSWCPHFPISPINRSTDSLVHTPFLGWNSSRSSIILSKPSSRPGLGGSKTASIWPRTSIASSGEVREGCDVLIFNRVARVVGEAWRVRTYTSGRGKVLLAIRMKCALCLLISESSKWADHSHRIKTDSVNNDTMAFGQGFSYDSFAFLSPSPRCVILRSSYP